MEEESLNNQEDSAKEVTKDNISSGLQRFDDIKLNMKVVIGKINMPIQSFLKITRGTIIEIGKSRNETMEIFVNEEKIGDCDIVIEGEAVLAEITKIKKKGKIG